MIKKHIGIFLQLPPDSTEEKIATAQITADDYAERLRQYWLFFAHRFWDVQVRGYVLLGEESTHPPYYLQTDIKTFMESHDMQGFEPNYFFAVGGFSQGFCGQANIGGSRGVKYSHYACGFGTIPHETGHMFGLHHANAWDGEKSVEYGDNTSIMGGSQSVPGLNSVELIRLGLETGRETKNITETEQVLLCPIELSEIGMHENEYQNIVIKRDNQQFHLSIRKHKGILYGTRDKLEDNLYIHEWKQDKHSVRYPPDLRPGQSKTLPNGVKIEYLEYKDETARVNVYYNADDPTPVDIPMPEGFPEHMPTVELNPEHSGAWFNPKHTGEGLNIHVKDGRMVFYWYTYVLGKEYRRWYYAVCNVSEGIEEFDIYTTDKGTWRDPTLHKKIPVGKGQIYFLDDTYGVFSYNTIEHGRGTISIVPVALASDHPSNGEYFQASREGEGFNIQFYDYLNKCVAFFYTYGPLMEAPIPGMSGVPVIQRQRWYTCVGNKQEDGSYNLTIKECPNNSFMEFRDKPGTEKVGNAVLNIVDDDNITFDYTINAPRISRTGTFNLTKLF